MKTLVRCLCSEEMGRCIIYVCESFSHPKHSERVLSINVYCALTNVEVLSSSFVEQDATE